MRKVYQFVVLFILFFSCRGYSQVAPLTCFNPSLGVYNDGTGLAMSPIINCDLVDFIRIRPASIFSVSGTSTMCCMPCIRLLLGNTVTQTPPNASSNNSVTLGEGTALNISCLAPSGCFANIPNNLQYAWGVAPMDPTKGHGYNMCNIATGASFPYTVASCYANTPLPPSGSGTWNNTPAGNCQTVTIPAGSAIGLSGYTVVPAVPATASTSAAWGYLYLDSWQMAPGTYTINYSFNSQVGPTATASRTIQIVNPYNASWTAPAAQCASAACFSLMPGGSATPGGTFVGTGVGSNSFCPNSVGAGTYNVTYVVGVSTQCSASQTNNIIVNALPVANAGPTKSITCANTQTILSGSGGGSYSWSGPGIVSGGATANPTVSLSGNYSLTVNNGSCTSVVSTVQVGVNTNSPAATASSSGSITCVNNVVSLTAGPSSMSYTWSVPASCTVSAPNSATPTGTGSCTYTVTVMDPANGCTKTATVSPATNMTTTPASAGTSGVITCTSTSFNLTSSPAGAMSYSWTAPAGGSITGGVTNQNTTGSGAGVYTVTIRDVVTGCPSTATASPATNLSTSFSQSATATGVITCSSNTINLSVTGSGISSYTWTAPGGGSVSPPNSATPVGTGAGTYSVVVTGTNGCVASSAATVSPSTNLTPFSGATASSTGTITCSSNTVNLTAGGAGATSYTWIAPGGCSVAPPNSANPVGTGLGTYSVIVAGSNGCPSTNAATVIPATNMSTSFSQSATATGIVTCNSNTINLSVSGTGISSYTWTAPAGGSVSPPNSASPIGSGAGVYSVVVTGTNGCVASTAATVSPSTNFTAYTGGTATATGTITCSSFTFNLNASGPGALTYSWVPPAGGSVSSTTLANPIGTGFGTYSVYIAGANGCFSSNAYTVIPQQTSAGPTSFSATCTGSVSCNSFTTTLGVTGSGIASYTWTAPGGCSVSSSTVANPIATGYGTYSVAVTGTNGCVSSLISTVTPGQNTTTPVGYSITATGSITCGTNTVQLNVGGGGVTSYTWLPPSGCGTCAVSNSTISNPVGTGLGTYSVIVAGSNGCASSAAAGTINPSTNFTTPTVNATANSSITCSSSTFSLGGSPVSGGTYTWTAPGTSSVSNPNSLNTNATGAGTYTLSFTSSSNGCTGTSTVAAPFSTLAPVSVSATSSGTVYCNSPSVNLGVTAGYTYSWMPPSGCGTCSVGNPTVASTTGSGAGIYSVVVTGTNGCSTTVTVSPTSDLTPPTVTAIPIPSITCANTTTIITANPSSGVLYSWSGPGIIGATNQQTVQVSQVNNYTVTLTNLSNGCTTTTVATVGSNTIAPTALGGGSVTVTCANPNATLTGAANPSTCTPSWTFAPGSNTTCITAMNTYSLTTCGTGTYYLVAINPANGCPSSAVSYTVGSNTPIPQATVVNTGTITCTTTTASVMLTTTISPVSYTWSGPGIVSATNQSSITVNMGGAYTYTLLDITTGCSITPVVNVAVDNSTVSVTTAASNTISCTTATAVLSATPSPVGSFTYSWSGPSSFTSSVASPTVVNSGTYAVVATNTVNGCIGSATLAVVPDTTRPTSVMISPSSFTLPCNPPTTTLSASATGASTYSWIAPSSSGGVIVGSATNPTVTISGAGTYSCVVSGTNGCSAPTATALIMANPSSPQYTLSNSSPSITCMSSSPTISVSITSTAPITGYTWSPGTGISGATNTSVVTFTAAGTYTGTIQDNSGCISNAIITVTSATTIPAFVAGSGTASAISCINPTITISPTYTPSGSYTYSWSGPGIVGTGTNSSVQANQNGIYTVTVVDPVTGCSSGNTQTVVVVGTSTPPAPNITSSSTIGIGCTPSTTTNTLMATPATGATYTWTGPGSFTSNSQNPSITTPGVYVVSVTDITSMCTASTSYTVIDNSSAPTATSVANVNLPCGGSSATVALNGGSPDPNVIYSWSGPGIISGSNTTNPIVNAGGSYTLTVSNPTTGCTSTSTVFVTNGMPVASFTTDITSGFAPQAVNFTDASSGSFSLTYSWSFGDGNSSTVQNPVNTYSVAGTYTAMLIVSTGLCSDTASVVITIEDGFSLTIPNVFTPNGDNVNDVFTITSSGVKEITLQIFNRWGQLMYEFNGAKAAWDGITNNGNEASAGTYFYFVKATGLDGKEVSKNGSLTLFR